MGKIESLKRKAAYYRALVNDPDTPRIAKALIVAALAYLASPIDLIPDFIPILGHLDDLLIVPLLLWLAMLAIPKAVKRRVAAEQAMDS